MSSDSVLDGGVVLRTPSLTLRGFRSSDASRILALSREATLARRIPDQVYANEREAAEVLRYLVAQYPLADPRSGPYVLAVCMAGSGDLVGHVGFSATGDEVEIGYAIGMAHQNRGLATQCVRAAAPWAIEKFGIESMVGIVATDNAASCRVLERSGFVLESEGDRMLHGRVQPARRYRRSAARPIATD